MCIMKARDGIESPRINEGKNEIQSPDCVKQTTVGDEFEVEEMCTGL
jgi:hypothetical protein